MRQPSRWPPISVVADRSPRGARLRRHRGSGELERAAVDDLAHERGIEASRARCPRSGREARRRGPGSLQPGRGAPPRDQSIALSSRSAAQAATGGSRGCRAGRTPGATDDGDAPLALHRQRYLLRAGVRPAGGGRRRAGPTRAGRNAGYQGRGQVRSPGRNCPVPPGGGLAMVISHGPGRSSRPPRAGRRPPRRQA